MAGASLQCLVDALRKLHVLASRTHAAKLHAAIQRPGVVAGSTIALSAQLLLKAEFWIHQERRMLLAQIINDSPNKRSEFAAERIRWKFN